MKISGVCILAFILLWACREENVKSNSLAIDVQASFNQDKVQILIDNKEIVNKSLQTNNLLGVCDDGRLNVQLREGHHVIKIVVNNLTTKSETFLFNKALYIGINFSGQTKEISLVYSDHPFAYD